MFVWNSQAILKLLWICSGRILQACAYHEITMVFIRLPVTVSSRQNPGSQKYSPNSDWNPQTDLLKVFGVSLEMSSDRLKYFGFKLDQFTELVFTVKIAQLSTQPFMRPPVTVSNRLNARQSKTKQFYGIHKLGKFVECKTRILFRIAWHF